MSNRQIQPVRNQDIQIIRQARSRSLWGQVWNVALQPNNFFLALPQTPSSSRQWFWVAVLILALNGFSAVRQEALLGSTGGGTDTSSFQQRPPEDFSSQPGGGFSISPGGIPGGIPGDFGAPPDTSAPSADISSTWVTALISGTTILLGWFVLAVILCEVPLFNGVRPSFGQNLQIAIWTTVPLGVMAGLQVIYFAAGGKVGAGGISGLLDIWKGYHDLSPLVRSILLSLTSRLTIFWLWTLVLIFIGARNALNGKVWAVTLVLIVWILVVVMVPVITGSITAPTVINADSLPEQITLPMDDSSVPEATFDENDLFLTDGTDEPTDSSSLVTPLALPAGSGVISTVEAHTTPDEIITTKQPADNGDQARSEIKRATAAP